MNTCETCGRELRAGEEGTCSYECQLEKAVRELTNKKTLGNIPLQTLTKKGDQHGQET